MRVLKAMFLRPADADSAELHPPSRAIAVSIVLGTIVVVGFGLYPAPLIEQSRGMAMPMLSDGGEAGHQEMKARGN